MAPSGRLRGRAGVITGAASGIGAAGAELFAAQGAALVLVDVDAGVLRHGCARSILS
jgi:NAD(P)-dependent dehydrogenase (short-subunit alcohol dehydrogenase family)